MTEVGYGTSAQFHRVILRMMPEWASSISAGRLIAGILAQAWFDGGRDDARRFFANETGILERYCSVCGLEWEQVRKMYQDHCHKVRRGR
jgi:hypothetical protein